jgi:hypothetical protein
MMFDLLCHKGPHGLRLHALSHDQSLAGGVRGSTFNRGKPRAAQSRPRAPASRCRPWKCAPRTLCPCRSDDTFSRSLASSSPRTSNPRRYHSIASAGSALSLSHPWSRQSWDHRPCPPWWHLVRFPPRRLVRRTTWPRPVALPRECVTRRGKLDTAIWDSGELAEIMR